MKMTQMYTGTHTYSIFLIELTEYQAFLLLLLYDYLLFGRH